jgi:hypothetical protein
MQPFSMSAQGAAGGTGTVVFLPTWIGQTVTIDSLIVAIGTIGVTGATGGVGVYNDAGDARPGALLASGVTGMASPSSTVINIPLSPNIQLTPGWYWFAYQYPDNTQKLFCLENTAGTGVNQHWHQYAVGEGVISSVNLGQSSNAILGFKAASTIGALPNPGNAVGAYTETTNIIFPIMAYRVKSVP